MTGRIAIIAGARTPFCKAFGALAKLEADALGAHAVKETLARSGLAPEDVDELIFGNVMQPPHLANIARIIGVKGGLPIRCPAVTVSRNCASGMEAVVLAADKIRLGQATLMMAGGAEAMSQISVQFPNEMRLFLMRLNKARNVWQRLGVLSSVRPRFFKPVLPGLDDPLCGLNMGQTAEVLVREFKISRDEQDRYALASQQRAAKAREEGRLAEEIAPLPLPPDYGSLQVDDDGIRDGSTLEGLAKLRPVFDKRTGTVTAGNASQLTDGAVAMILMSEEEAQARGLQPIAYLGHYAAVGLEPSRMGLGPAYATAKLLQETGRQLSDFDLIEINEAFAAQILAVEKAFASRDFAKKELGLDRPVGELNHNILNVNGGAIALGHPLGASGARLILTLALELRRRNKQLGLATLCVGGGQGQAITIEAS